MEKLPFENIKREILIKKQTETNPNYGCEPEKRAVETLINYGIVNIDKPKGPTSHQVSDYVKRVLGLDKAGHSGTLDPAVTGVLPVALGKATRIVQTLLPAGKEYVALMHIHKDVGEDKVKEAFVKFTGKIKQIPPIKSSVRRRERERNIYYIKLLEIDEKDVLFIVGCEAGTYIRKLCLHPETEILSEKGLVKAKEFYPSPGSVFTADENRIKLAKCSATQKIKSPAKLIRVTAASGVSFVVTPDHEMLVSYKDGYKMTEASKLKRGNFLVKSLTFPNIQKTFVIVDLLDDSFLIQQNSIKEECKKAFLKKYGSIRAMNRHLKLDRKSFLLKSNIAIRIKHLKIAGIYEKVRKKIRNFKTEKGTIINLNRLNKDFFYLLGLIASDGNNTKEKNTIRHTRIKFHNKEEKLVESFIKSYKKLFPNIPLSNRKVRGNLYEIDTSNSFLATVSASLGIKSPQKDSDILPLVYLEKKHLRSFLRGYFDGDGTAYFKEKKCIKGYYTDIRFFSVNPISAKRIHQMLLKLDIPNKIFHRKNIDIVSIESLAAKHKFIKEVGTNHPKKKRVFDKILELKNKDSVQDHYYIGMHYKEELKKNKKKLRKMGGNLSRILKGNTPVTRRFYKKSSKFLNLPRLDGFIIEKISLVEHTRCVDFVYDLTVPKTHNFLIETGFVSSNCHDIGKDLGVGAHMAELRRTKAGPFDESTIVTLQNLTDAFYYFKEGDEKQIRKCIQPFEKAVSYLPKIWVLDSTVNSLTHGADLNNPGIAKLDSGIEKEDLVAIFTLKGELVCLGIAKATSKRILEKEKGLAVKTEKVFMDSKVYPRI